MTFVLRVWSAFFVVMLPLICLGVDLEENVQPFVLEIKRIKVPGYPHAFNPSVIRWNGSLWMTFREIPDPKQPFISRIGIVALDESFQPVSEPCLLELQPPGADPDVPSRAEDARLIQSNGKLLMVYSDNRNAVLTGGGFRVHIAELVFEDGQFAAKNIEVLTSFEGENPRLREKNWVPFIYRDELLLAYSLTPHLIFRPLFNGGICETFAQSHSNIDWEWGILRGGTPGTQIDADHYLSFFHSSKKMSSVHASKEMPHYFMGAYTFSVEPPFEIDRISPEPIIAKGFYSGEEYPRYWGSVKAIFPAGFVFDDKYIWVFYGRQDHEIWAVKLDKKALLDSLVPVP